MEKKRKEKEAKLLLKKEEGDEVTQEEKKNYQVLQNLKEEFINIHSFAISNLKIIKAAIHSSTVSISSVIVQLK